jgi:hypothetical protein
VRLVGRCTPCSTPVISISPISSSSPFSQMDAERISTSPSLFHMSSVWMERPLSGK